jgi:RHS repeat-associated protein
VGPDSANNPNQYTSRENDNTGLYYYRARYYDPVLKMFVSSDPIGLAGGMNSYSYVAGNPLSFTDPTGLICEYSQGARTFICTNAAGVTYASCTGYSGNGQGLNNSNAQNQPNVGPIPQGSYTVGGSTTRRGPNTRPLTPYSSNNMYGRAGFLLHGDNAAQNNTASEGCIIIPPACRVAVPAGETVVVRP